MLVAKPAEISVGKGSCQLCREFVAELRAAIVIKVTLWPVCFEQLCADGAQFTLRIDETVQHPVCHAWP